MLKWNRENILAYTPPGLEPPFLSVNVEKELRVVTVHVRSPKEIGGQAQIDIPLDEFCAMAADMVEKLKEPKP